MQNPDTINYTWPRADKCIRPWRDQDLIGEYMVIHNFIPRMDKPVMWMYDLFMADYPVEWSKQKLEGRREHASIYLGEARSRSFMRRQLLLATAEDSWCLMPEIHGCSRVDNNCCRPRVNRLIIRSSSSSSPQLGYDFAQFRDFQGLFAYFTDFLSEILRIVATCDLGALADRSLPVG